jgi:ribosomal protein S18 acetylase RimI-like enzyme
MPNLRYIKTEDIPHAKALADANRLSVGFMTKGKFDEAVQQKRGIIAIENEALVGFVLYRHRKIDQQTTLSEICVKSDYRGQNVGKQLVDALIQDCKTNHHTFIQLKCPVDLPANEFYRRIGFQLYATEAGKKRPLNIWRFTVSCPNKGEG